MLSFDKKEEIEVLIDSEIGALEDLLTTTTNAEMIFELRRSIDELLTERESLEVSHQQYINLRDTVDSEAIFEGLYFEVPRVHSNGDIGGVTRTTAAWSHNSSDWPQKALHRLGSSTTLETTGTDVTNATEYNALARPVNRIKITGSTAPIVRDHLNAYYENSNQYFYPKFGCFVLPIKNVSDSTETLKFRMTTSSYSTYSGTSVWVGTPDDSDKLSVTSVDWVMDLATQTNNQSYDTDVTVDLEGGKTTLLFITTSPSYYTNNQIIVSQYEMRMYELNGYDSDGELMPSLLNNPNLQPDLDLLKQIENGEWTSHADWFVNS